MERTTTARNRPAHPPHRKHGEPPDSHVELGRCGGGVGRAFVRYFDACASLIYGADKNKTPLCYLICEFFGLEPLARSSLNVTWSVALINPSNRRRWLL